LNKNIVNLKFIIMEDFFEEMRKSVEIGIKNISNPKAVMLGSNMYIGQDGILKYNRNNRLVDFFKIRDIYRQRSEGSYLAVDVDIKDNEGKREVKLAKSKVVASDKDIFVDCSKTETIVRRPDNSIIIKVEQIDPSDETLPKEGPVRMAIDSKLIQAIIRITGDFRVDSTQVFISNDELRVDGGGTLKGNLKTGGDFLMLHPEGGFSF
jgi:hypothetical protein